MSLVVLTSASGSPGVTTTALGLALTWHRPCLLVEADPTGGSAVAAGYLRGQVVPPESMIELAVAQQEGRSLLDALAQHTIDLPGTDARFVPGTRSHDQARSLVGLWEPLAAALRSLEDTGQDVIVDAGRLGLLGSPEPVLEFADLALLVIRNDLVALSAARSWAETLRDRLDGAGAGNALGVLLVGDGGPFGAREVARVLALPVVATVAWDPAHAAVLSHGAPAPRAGSWQRLAGRSGWDDSTWLRSIRAAASAIAGTIRATDARLDPARGGQR